jgi:hypothetical protein
MSVPRSVQKAVNEGRKEVKYCPPVRAILANRRFQRTLTAFAPLIRERSPLASLGENVAAEPRAPNPSLREGRTRSSRPMPLRGTAQLPR